MNDALGKHYPGPIPGFDCVEMKRRAQRRIYAQIKGMTDQQLLAYFQRRHEELAAGRPLAVAEPPAPYGDAPQA